MTVALIIGDILALLVTTLIGFATHNELKSEFFLRMVAAIIPLTIAWFLLAPWFGLFQPDIIRTFAWSNGMIACSHDNQAAIR